MAGDILFFYEFKRTHGVSLTSLVTLSIRALNGFEQRGQANLD